MNLDLYEKNQAELEKLLIGKTVSITDQAENINVQRATVKAVGLPNLPAFWVNEGKICILDTDVGKITVWDTSIVNLVD